MAVKKSSQSYENEILGVISASPAFRIQADKENWKPIALIGRVEVKVSTENGNISVGDLLTSSSLPGVAMRANESGRVIGLALDNYDQEGIGKVLVFVNPHWSMGKLAEGSLTLAVKNSLKKLGLLLGEGISQVKKLIAEEIITKKARVEKLEMIDQVTGQIWCTLIENGEWVRTKGECD